MSETKIIHFHKVPNIEIPFKY